MLLELNIENYAVVERLRVRFHAGLNLLTGETGSGKSIVVDALGLLFGGRASTEMIRSGEDRARACPAIFECATRPRWGTARAGRLRARGRRTADRARNSGRAAKSRAFVGSRPAAVSLLREIGAAAGRHSRPARPATAVFHRRAARDAGRLRATTATCCGRVGSLYAAGAPRRAELEDLEHSEQEKLRLLDLWSFQRKEIESAGPKPGEDAALEKERRVLQNLGRLQESAGDRRTRRSTIRPNRRIALLRRAR